MRFLIALLAGLLALTACSSGEGGKAASRNTQSLSQAPAAKGAEQAQARLAVVGVAHRDKLNVRSSPEPRARVLARLAPLTTGVQPTGNRAGSWVQVKVDGGTTGWVHGRYLGALAKAVDVTAEARAVGIAPSRKALLRKVAAQQAESGETTLIGPVLVARQGNTLTGDVLGYADDAIAGDRFVLVLVPGEAGFEVSSAMAIAICARGVDQSGRCA